MSSLPPFVLQELPDITNSIQLPLKSAQRIKYTCFDISKTLIAFGATSGGIYVFNRNPCELLQLIPNKDGAITRLSISSDEKHIGFANGRGIITVTACDQALTGGHSTVMSKEHQNNEVTALIWSANMLFSGDDVGKVAVLQLQNFIAKTMFQSSSLTIMSLDSRICQLDIKGSMLLVSTLTRCYICDTTIEQYRQIGHKLRDGEFGACFFNKEKVSEGDAGNQNIIEFKRYNIVDDNSGFVCNDNGSTLIYCARPSSRLWEASIDGTVKRTHQYKHVLSKNPMPILSCESYSNENYIINNISNDATECQSLNFHRILAISGTIFSFTKEALYFLNPDNVDNTIWYCFRDIVECKVYHDTLYIWLTDGSIINLRFMKIEKFLVKCFIDEKYVLCSAMCALYKDYLISNSLSNKLHILASLKDKLTDREVLDNIEDVLKKFDSLKSNEATQMKSGIYVVENTYNTSSYLNDDNGDKGDVNMFNPLPPEAVQKLKDLSSSVTDKLTTSKKILKEKWEGFEDKVKNLGTDRQQNEVDCLPERDPRETRASTSQPPDENIIYKESSQKHVKIGVENEELLKSLYQYFILGLLGKSEATQLVNIVERYSCDINKIYELMIQLEQYCESVRSEMESSFISSNVFLNYLNNCSKRSEILDAILRNELLYEYFVDSCVTVNSKIEIIQSYGCDCGYPLPHVRTNKTPMFSELIEEFVEKRYSSTDYDENYDICMKLPFLWRKILLLQGDKDLLNLLDVLMQMLDEKLLRSFLPKFTTECWDKALNFFSILIEKNCLNCDKIFEKKSVKDKLTWDDIGALIIKSVGGKNAVKILEKHSILIGVGNLSLKFYHTAILVALYERYDATITSQLVDSLYCTYKFEDCRTQICKLLRETSNGQIKNTSLPLIIAAKCSHWGLTPMSEADPLPINMTSDEHELCNQIKNITLDTVITNLNNIYNSNTDCPLCGLPLGNGVLMRDGGVWVFKCGHTFHGSCLELNKQLKLCPSCQNN